MIELAAIRKTFRIAGKKKQVLRNVTLQVSRGEIVAITGESGCGKSTILNIIAGLTHPDKGRLFLENRRIFFWLDLMPSWIRSRKIGLVFQTFKLVNEESVAANILLSARIRGRVNAEIKRNLKDYLQELGIAEYEKTRVSLLSGGQKQRVALARSLINNPALILADEPTANLDRKTSQEIFNVLERLAREEMKAIIIVTHKEYMLQRADRVFELKNGVLVEQSRFTSQKKAVASRKASKVRPAKSTKNTEKGSVAKRKSGKKSGEEK
jgi:ABC-type lipoprotein export system ATPase subunit